jgi:glycosidase
VYEEKRIGKPEIWIHEKSREFVYPKSREELVLECSLPRDSEGDLSLIYWNRFTESQRKPHIVKMKRYARESQFDHYYAVIEESEPIRYLRYFFQWRLGGQASFLSTTGILEDEPRDHFFEYLCTNEQDIFSLPKWWQDAIVYQIFPERFKKGDSMHAPAPCEDWGGEPTRENFFGGNLRGIMDAMGYLVDLGVNTLYLNPIFESPSNHKYDTIDYFRIDSHFGTLEEFKELLDLCHQNGIRVILDGVFNHIGYYSKQFQDVLENGKESEYAEWFYLPEGGIETDPLNYECVGYYKWMPKLRFSTQSVRRHCLRVGAYWLEIGIDGWRLDVCDEVDYTFWQEFRRMVKKINPQAVLLGETWGDGREMMRGDQMDSVMNYLFRDAVLDFIAKESIDAIAFADLIGKMFSNYPIQSHSGLLNLIGSHDTERFMTAAGGESAKLQLAAALQFTVLGVPMVYYGDEHAMEGENDPDCRRAMCWDAMNLEMQSLYQRLIRIRKENSALREGVMEIIHAREGSFAFLRKTESQIILVLMNRDSVAKSIRIPLQLDQKKWSGKSLMEKGNIEIQNNPETMIGGSLAAQAFDIILLKEEENE